MEKAAVLGAGVMGAQIAAHLANAGIPVVLLDIVPPDTPAEADATTRSRLALSALEKLHKMKPAPFFLASHAARIRAGNFEDHLEWLRDADWIIEAVTEDLAIKRALYEKIEPFRKPGSLITSNTSGIPLPRWPKDVRKIPAKLSGHALLQPAALHVPCRADPNARHRPGSVLLCVQALR
jgi:3-hydroxyacyl-CoA dehydrogenase (EC 1.1.1.35)